MRRSTAWTAILLGLTVLLAGEAAVAQALYLPIERQTSGRRVRSAFKGATGPATAWTVEVRRGKTAIALGVVVSSKGQILTKLSEVQSVAAGNSQLVSTNGADSTRGRLSCLLSGGRNLDATIIATDAESDLALLEVEADGLKAAEWANNFDPKLGRWVVSPTLGGAVTAVGIVSAQRRSIPSEKVSGVLGVQLDRVGGTARIMEVFEDSGAQAADLKPGDLIQRCDDKDIDNSQSLISRLRQKKPGEEVTLKVKRDETTEIVKVTLTHPFGVFLSQFAQQNRMGTELSNRLDGFTSVFSHDGHVNPEECGGPLLDLEGRVVGINIARSGRTETLVLPVDVVEKALERLQAQVAPEPPMNVSTEGKTE